MCQLAVTRGLLPCFGRAVARAARQCATSTVSRGMTHNGRWFMPVQPLDKTNEPHGLAQLGGVSGENETT
jgi:hypothetical protein